MAIIIILVAIISILVILVLVLRDNLRGPIKVKSLTKAIERNLNDVEAYWKRGEVYRKFYHDCRKDVLGLAISDYSKAIDLRPDFAKAYYSRAIIYYNKREYAKSWQDVHKAETLGFKVDSKFLKKVSKACENLRRFSTES